MDEMATVMEDAYGWKPDKRELDKMLKQFDQNGDGLIDFDEFSVMHDMLFQRLVLRISITR